MQVFKNPWRLKFSQVMAVIQGCHQKKARPLMPNVSPHFVHVPKTLKSPQIISKSPPKFPKSLLFYSVLHLFISEMCQWWQPCRHPRELYCHIFRNRITRDVASVLTVASLPNDLSLFGQWPINCLCAHYYLVLRYTQVEWRHDTVIDLDGEKLKITV